MLKIGLPTAKKQVVQKLFFNISFDDYKQAIYRQIDTHNIKLYYKQATPTVSKFIFLGLTKNTWHINLAGRITIQISALLV